MNTKRMLVLSAKVRVKSILKCLIVYMFSPFFIRWQCFYISRTSSKSVGELKIYTNLADLCV